MRPALRAYGTAWGLFLFLALGLALALGSSCTREPPVVVIQVAPLPANAELLTLTVNGLLSVQHQSFDPAQRELFLQLPIGAMGQLGLQLDVVDAYHCVIANQYLAVQVDGSARQDVMMAPQSVGRPRCISGSLLNYRNDMVPLRLDRGPNVGKFFIAAGVDLNAPELPVLNTELYDAATGGSQPGPKLLFRGDGAPPLRLADGRILLTAGYDYQRKLPLNTAQIYAPLTNDFHQAANLNVARSGAAAILLPDGRVLVAGGKGGTPYQGIKSTEIYDPALNTWTEVDDMAFPRQFPAPLLLPSGKVLMIGGGDHPNPLPLAIELFDPSARPGSMWTVVGSLRTGTLRAAVYLLPGDKVAVVYGGDLMGMLDGMEVLDLNNLAAGGQPAPESWYSLSYAARVQMPSGSILFTGGGSKSATADVELFDGRRSAFVKQPPLYSPRALHAATLLPGGGVLLMGGINGRLTKDGSANQTVSTEILDPAGID